MKINNQDIKVSDLVQIEAGASYVGLVTEITDAGLWVTEDNLTEEFISFADISKSKVIYRLVKGHSLHEK